MLQLVDQVKDANVHAPALRAFKFGGKYVVVLQKKPERKKAGGNVSQSCVRQKSRRVVVRRKRDASRDLASCLPRARAQSPETQKLLNEQASSLAKRGSEAKNSSNAGCSLHLRRSTQPSLANTLSVSSRVEFELYFM